ncbi:MAG: inositol monophosphatase family protein [Nitrospiraceae bacterium]|nr:inositol monophosphatase family protein [Nitrospiraceae bacterium]
MTDNLLNEFLKTAVSAARLAGDIIIKNLGHLSKEDVQTKQAFDFVTKVDRWSEAVIMQTLREKFPSHRFLTEETLKQEDTGEYRWIIDPLDGTTNYIHSYPMFAVSIALEYESEIIMGVVFDPLKDELFHAVRGGGSFLNNRKITVSGVASLEKSLVATGFPFRSKEMIDHYLHAFKEIFREVSDIRRAGSAAIDLSYVAAGRFEGFFELKLSPWDVAAGALLIEEAGGIVTDFGGGKEYLSSGNIVAGNRYIQPQIFEAIKQVFQGIVDK